MKFHVLTLFPEMILQGLGPSIIGRAAEKNLISLNAVNIRDYTTDKHGKVDDYPYGGGAGMLMQAQPVFDAYRSIQKQVRTIYVTPQGRPFTQKLARELAAEEELVFLCGHYEGIDERALEEIVTDYVSIGDYVLTGGELPAMVMIDAIARLIPGVLGNESSAEEESFHNDLLEYPQYSRPEVWHGKQVPQVLLSGNHKNISQWRLEQSIERTAQRRPDLYEKYQRKQRLIRQLSKDKRNNIHMMESLESGKSEILYANGEDLLLYDRQSKTAAMLAKDAVSGEKLAAKIPADAEWMISSQEFLNEILTGKQFTLSCQCRQFLYTQKVTLPVKYKNIRPLGMEHLDYVCSSYCMADKREDLTRRIRAGAMYGVFAEDKLIGFMGIHSDGRIGMLYIEESYRGKGYAKALEAYVVNRLLERGRTPYGHVAEGNDETEKLQEKLGFYKASGTFYRWERRMEKPATDSEKSTCI